MANDTLKGMRVAILVADEFEHDRDDRARGVAWSEPRPPARNASARCSVVASGRDAVGREGCGEQGKAQKHAHEVVR
jgi:hypothetical protein